MALFLKRFLPPPPPPPCNLRSVVRSKMFYRDNTTKNTGLEVTFTFLALVAAIVMALFSQYFPAITPWILLIVMLALLVFYLSYQENIRRWVEDTFILQMPCDSNSLPSRREHDFRRNLTYPPLVPNAWYHLCDASDLPPGKVLEFRACNQVFVVWRGKDGIPVCQDAYCLHQGANLGVGGTVVDDNCLQCPFHFWKFDKDGNVVEIPYNSNPKNVPKFAKLKTYPCVEWCGWICVYYHADGKEPEYQLPSYVPKELKEGNFKLHLKWNAGHRTTNVIDLVDQVCDHAHFNLLHGEFIIPWTLLPMPAFLKKWLPLGIRHELTTFQGDDKDWKEAVERTGWGEVNKYLLYFYDKAGITWNGKLIETTLSQTTEMYIGPSLVVFHIPIPIGTIKLFLSFTPVEGGVIIRARTFIDDKMNVYWKKWIAWLLAGIAASQLQYDLRIMSNRIRPKKPIVQPTDGPFHRTNTWLKNFFSEGSKEACSLTNPCAYNNDW